MAKQSTHPDDLQQDRDDIEPEEETQEVDYGPVLSREEILAANDIELKIVPTPEWGGCVYVRSLNGEERAKVEVATVRKDGSVVYALMRERLVIASTCDQDGTLLFSEKGDLVALSKKSSAPLDRIFEAAQGVSGMVASAVDDAVKN